MKPRETALRLKQFEVDEKTRKVEEMERMIREFETISSELDRQIQAEEDRTGIKDPAHFAYSTYARSARDRREKLRASAEELRESLNSAIAERDIATEQLQRYLAADLGDVDRVGRRRVDRPVANAAR